MVIQKRHLIIAAYLYMVVPILVFFTTWLNPLFGFSFACILAIGTLYLLKQYRFNTEILNLSKKDFLKITILILLFVYFSGQGGFFFQYHDNHWRNAVYRDLIQYEWPVIYQQTGNGLVYYIMHWIFPAFLCKILSLTRESYFVVARLILFAWTYSGVLLCVLLLAVHLKIKSSNSINILLAVFLSWSGINIIGGILYNALGLSDFGLNTYLWWTNFSIEGQPYAYMYRSNMDQLASTYNQTIIPWIATILFLDKKEIKNFAFLGLCVLPYAPLPFLGLFAVLIIYATPELIKKIWHHNYKQCLTDIFSIQNISALTIFVTFLFYFSCNVAYKTGSQFDGGLLYVPLGEYNLFRILTLLLFYLLYFGLYAFFIRKQYKKNFLFKVVLALLTIIPFFRIGVLADFCWNVSVVPYFMLMIFVINFLITSYQMQSKLNFEIIGLIICLSLASLNPISQVAFGAKIALQERTVLLMTDNIKTFSDKEVYDPNVDFTYNFLTPHPEVQPFYKYLARSIKIKGDNK